MIGINPAMEMSQVRAQQTLAMEGSASAAPAAAPAAAGPAAQAAAGTAAPGAAADAAMGAAAVQPPPSTSKTVLQSVLRGAMTGASVTLGIKQFAPLLGRIGFIGNMIGKLPVAGAAGAGLLGFLGKIPILGSIVGKVVPALSRTGIGGFLIAGLIGAGVGAIFGAISGLKKAKAETAAYAEAQAKAQADAAAAAQAQMATPVPEPGSAAEAPPAAPVTHAKKSAHKPRYKSWVVAKSGSHTGTQKYSNYTTKGETIDALAKRFYTTPDEIRKLNPSIGDGPIASGTKLKLARKVVPDAKRWVA